MNLRKTLFRLTILIIFVAFILLQNAVYAETIVQPKSKWMGITELMSDNPAFGYSINLPNNEAGIKRGAKIWNIVVYPNGNNTSTVQNNENIYCLKEGQGFTSSSGARIQEYTQSFNMKTQRNQIKEEATGNQTIASLMEKTITENGKTINCYDAVLAVLDMLYLPNRDDEALTERNKIYDLIVDKVTKDDDYIAYREYADAIIGADEEHKITPYDIKAVQQAALWYFTNYGEDTEGGDVYNKTDDKGWIYYTTNSTDYNHFSNYRVTGDNAHNTAGEIRDAQAELLYNYIIKTAKENASKYTENISSAEPPATVVKEDLIYVQKEDKYIIGPIKIIENQSTSTPYTIDLTVNNGKDEIEYNLVNTDGSPLNSNIKDLVAEGKDVYIAIPTNEITDMNSLSVDIGIHYNDTTMTLWTQSGWMNKEQPLVEVEKVKKSLKEPLKITQKEEKPFDLALRKYITKINGEELKGDKSRVPNIEEATLNTGTTATYKHKKDPVAIVTGDKVTYQLTIYNEGEKAGRATKIIDQLPTGLRFSQVISGNFELGNYAEDTNTLNLVRKANNTTNLPAYTSGNLGKNSETIEIECEVIAIADKKESKVLTNVAWIAEAWNEEGQVTTTNKDRDSEPSTYPNVNKDNMADYIGNNNKTDLTDSNYYYKGQQDDDDFEKLVLLPEAFDLKLIKRITAINQQNVPERIKSIDASKLNTLDSNGNRKTTADYDLNKEPLTVKKGDIVTYTFRIYNEGTINGYAQEITEDIPKGLQFLWSEKEGEELKADTTLSDEEKEAIEFNQKYLWGKFVYDDAKENIIQISSDYLSKENEATIGGNLIEAFGRNDGTKTEANLHYKELAVKLKVVSENMSGTKIRNEAAITQDCDENGNPVDDRDSEPENWIGKDDHNNYQDDEDFDNIILQSFDLALRKFIIAVSHDDKIEKSEELRNADSSYTRAPKVDTSKLNTLDENGKLITTAIYNHTKEPVEVSKNDYVVYMLRVYNEGEIDGYAAEIKDHLPSYLEFVKGEYNTQYGWQVSEDGKTVTTRYLENALIHKAKVEESGNIQLSYKEVPIMCRVKDTAKAGEKITNIAHITKYLDDKKQPVVDRDSVENNVQLPDSQNLPGYKENETGSYVPGQEDDDDFEKVIIKRFDLALRKFITKIGDKEVTTRIPEIKYENGKISYEHSKEPLMVVTNNIVTYTIRVFNEGEVAGYATEITDDIPAGLEFLPDNELNKTMRWKMIDKEGKETTDVTKAVKITTDYLAKEQEKQEKANLLKAFNPDAQISDTNPDHKEVQVAFRVTEPNSSDKIIINSAQISEDSDENGNPIDDDDSIPNEWNEGEDDQDREYIKLVEFDLALRKWVTQAIVIENGKQTVTQTGHDPWDDPEAVVKVELHRKKLNQVTVKFRYSIRVINQGDIAGYAKEVTDYVPQGLKFVAEDNPGWTDEGNNVISTRLLENKLLQPGEYADVEVLLTWVNSENNMGVMNNTAEISEDYNEYGVPDKDSTPDNQKPGEDDIDDAPVMLSIGTGQIRIYFTLGFIVLVTIAGGVILIKKFVL